MGNPCDGERWHASTGTHLRHPDNSRGDGQRCIRANNERRVFTWYSAIRNLHAGWPWGYGFPIGGVAAFDQHHGVISPGGIGFDINCGMRLIRTDLTYDDIQPKMEQLMTELFHNVPAGVGTNGFLQLSPSEFEHLMHDGVDWCIAKGYGWPKDRERIEEFGRLDDANPSKVSDKAIKRGIHQVGTLGSGNHYLEVQIVEDECIFDRKAAEELGLFGKNQVVVMVHCGSRGFGHQVASDFLDVFEGAMKKSNCRPKTVNSPVPRLPIQKAKITSAPCSVQQTQRSRIAK